jgi:hypothetical protein
VEGRVGQVVHGFPVADNDDFHVNLLSMAHMPIIHHRLSICKPLLQALTQSGTGRFAAVCPACVPKSAAGVKIRKFFWEFS